MIDFYIHSKEYIKKHYKLQQLNEKFYTEDNLLVAEPSLYLNNLLESDTSDLQYNAAKKIISFDLYPFNDNLRSIYIDNFFKKLFSNEIIFNGILSNNIKLILVFKNYKGNFKEKIGNDFSTLENMLKYAFESFGLSRSNMVIITDNLYLQSDFEKLKYHGINIVSDNFYEFDYINNPYNYKHTFDEYYSNIKKLTDVVINFKSKSHSIYDYLIVQYLKKSNNISKSIIDVNLLEYDYKDIKVIFDECLDACDTLNYFHLKKYFELNETECIELKKIKNSKDSEESYKNSLCTVILDDLDNLTCFHIDSNILDSMRNMHPLMFLTPHESYDNFLSLRYRGYGFMYRDKLVDFTFNNYFKIVVFLNDLDLLFNTNINTIVDNIFDNKKILEHNSNLLFSNNRTDYISSKILNCLEPI